MLRRLASYGAFVLLLSMLVSSAWAQNFTASVNGSVSDPSGAAIPGAEVTLTSVGTGWTAKFTTDKDGLYLFGNLARGVYTLKASAANFRDVEQKQINVNLNESVRVDVKMELGSHVETVEVKGSATSLNFDNGEVKGSITPDVIADLPLIVSGNQRSAAAFITLLAGVNTGGGADPYDSRINGGIQNGDEAVLDGVTMQEGVQSQSGMIAMYNDYPVTPESVNEVSVLKSDYEPQYGYTTAAVITAVTKSGTDQFHGSAHELLRNRVLNSRSFNAPQRPEDTENDWGATIGGPAKIPGVWGGNRKAYFFFAYGGYTVRGGTTSSILSLPSMLERQGDFSDWIDTTTGKLIPVYDPATTRANPNYNPAGPDTRPFLRDQFMGCDGTHPNVICPSDPRLTGSLANQWIKFIPTPTFAGPQHNFVGLPVASGSVTPSFDRVSYDARYDQYLGEKDHLSLEIHFHQPHYLPADSLPFQLATSEAVTHGGYVGPTMDRLNMDHTFSPTLLNNFNIGYSDYRGNGLCNDTPYTSDLPQIAGVAAHDLPPGISFQDFTSFGCNQHVKDTKPNMSFNDMMTWVHGKHTLKFGVDLRRFQLNLLSDTCGSGCFSFDRLNTGLSGIESGNSFASFLLEQVSSANTNVYTVNDPSARQHSLGLYVGDTFKVRAKLSLSYGLRWDMSTPSYENFDRFSFFNPTGTNPGAGGRPGNLAFAGTRWGSASFGARYPEKLWLKAFAPRLGFAYSLTPKTVVRAGYGIFFTQAFYPSWGGGMASDGLNSSPSLSSSLGGIQAAMVLSQGFPQFQQPPFIDPSFDNGQAGPLYRPFDSNRLSNAQQWNLTVERQLSQGSHVSVAYVANKGTRLPSDELPLNSLNPSLLSSLGQHLNDVYGPGDTSLDGVPIPYPGWVTQLKACSPTVAQALVPYPQYCGSLTGLNENDGNSTYHSFQVQVENRFAHNIYLMGSYTLSKLLTSSDFVNPAAETWSGATGVISPYERKRNKALSTDNVPQTLSLSLLYKLPFGRGQRFLNKSGALDKVVGGWETTNIFRIQGGVPFVFRSSVCNVPTQFDVGCIPGIIPGANPWALGKGKFSPNQSVFNAAAFESPSSFNFYYGQGPRVSSLRGPGYHNHDFGLIKDTPLTERVTLQFRGELFNIWNWHILNCIDMCFGSTAFTTDLASPNFGRWTGAVTAPRNIQLGMEILF